MIEKITIKNSQLIIKIPLKKKRSDIYNDDPEEMDNIIGLYEDEYNNGLCYRIDMSYKGKPDQYTDYFFKLNGTKKEFENLCKKLKIDYYFK